MKAISHQLSAVSKMIAVAIAMLVGITDAEAQVARLRGTSLSSFLIQANSATPCTLTNDGGTLSLVGLKVNSGTVTFSGATISNLGTITTADINGGTIDGTVIGGSTAAAGTFAALTGTFTGGSINNTPIGGSTPNSGSFTTIGASGQISSTLATGTAPFSIASTTKCTNLNADAWDGYHVGTTYGAGSVVVQTGATTFETTAVTTSANCFLVSGTSGTGVPTWANLASAHFFLGNSLNIPASVAMSGDATMSNTGALTIANSAISSGKVDDTSVGMFVPKIDVSGGTENGSHQITVTITITTLGGNNPQVPYIVHWWISDTQYAGAETAQSPTTTYTSSSYGSEWSSVVANKKGIGVTNSSGVLKLTITLTGTHTVYCNASGGGRVLAARLDFN